MRTDYGLDALAFGAHPDDVELFAAGTLAKLASLGHATGVVDLTRGERSTRGTPTIRAREAARAAKILGLRVRRNLGLADGNVRVDEKSRLKVIRVLRELRPMLLLVPYWEDFHPDHVHTSRLVTEAAHHAGLQKIDTRQKRFRPNAIVYYKLPDRVQPSFIVDVTAYQAKRDAAIRAYGSQLYHPAGADDGRAEREKETYLSQPGFLDRVDRLHAYYGTLIGTERGEGFYFGGRLEIADPVAMFRGRSPLAVPSL